MKLLICSEKSETSLSLQSGFKYFPCDDHCYPNQYPDQASAPHRGRQLRIICKEGKHKAKNSSNKDHDDATSQSSSCRTKGSFFHLVPTVRSLSIPLIHSNSVSTFFSCFGGFCYINLYHSFQLFI